MRRSTVAVAVAAALAVSGAGAVVVATQGSDGRAGPTASRSETDEGADPDAEKARHSDTIEHLATLPSSGTLAESYWTDLAFQGEKAFVGNYDGFSVVDISNPRRPRTTVQVRCPGSQNDISVSGDLLYLSTDSSRSDDSCESTSQSATRKESWEGIKIFDISDVKNPRYLTSVETACGSHTHTLVPGKGAQAGNDYLYVSSYGPDEEYPDCQVPHDLISIVEVDRADPESAEVVAEPNLFPDGGRTGPAEEEATGEEPEATTGCHDITALPHKNIAAGACMGDGIIMDISDPERPRVIERVRDEDNFAFWHSATFTADASKVVFTDELGGGGAATCDAETGRTHGADAIYDLSAEGRLTFRSYFKIPRHQGETENCVAHNGSIIPVAGRDLMVQSWYQGGVSVWDLTDADHPREIGWFDRGPLPESVGGGGSWSAYYYNGHIYSSDMTRGLDVLRFTDPVAKGGDRVVLDELNVQSQPDYGVR